MLIAGVVTLLNSVDMMSRVTMKVDTVLTDNVRRGRGCKMFFDKWARDEWEFRNYFFQDELGQLKYSVITGKILDYKV